MKYLVICMLFMITFYSCGSDDEELAPQGSFISGQVNGVNFNSDAAQATLFSVTETSSLFNIIGATTSDLVTAEEVLGVGFLVSQNYLLMAQEYNFVDDVCSSLTEPICGSLLYGDPQHVNGIEFSSSVEGGNSTVTISTLDYRVGGRVSGSFSGVLVNENDGSLITVENGRFEMSIQEL